MSTDEMFKELGYEKIVYGKTEIVYRFVDKNDDSYINVKTIGFYTRTKRILFSNGGGFSVKELKAINKKAEELGWNV